MSFNRYTNTEGSTKCSPPRRQPFPELKSCAVEIIRLSCSSICMGFTQQQAKQELGALIAACRREHVFCACVMHGHGKHILKQQTPLWLAQHPHIMAFHQAPKRVRR